MRPIGFSTGALAKANFRGALRMLAPHHLPCVELSALRMEEVTPLIDALPTLDLADYKAISFHAPSRFVREKEVWLSELLFDRVPDGWPIVMHPDAISNYGCWKRFGRRLAIENMDRRKPCGRGVAELASIFELLPEAALCFDIGHARQYDSSMTEAYLILSKFGNRLAQVHVSEVNSESQHDSISYGARLAFQELAELIPETTPVIVESRVAEESIMFEVEQARRSLSLLVAAEVFSEAAFA